MNFRQEACVWNHQDWIQNLKSKNKNHLSPFRVKRPFYFNAFLDSEAIVPERIEIKGEIERNRLGISRAERQDMLAFQKK